MSQPKFEIVETWVGGNHYFVEILYDGRVMWTGRTDDGGEEVGRLFIARTCNMIRRLSQEIDIQVTNKVHYPPPDEPEC